jgi:hypothetical protein
MQKQEQQTTVEWFCEQILLKNPILTQFLPNWNFDQSIIEKAKEMEKERMIGLLEWMNSVNQSDPMRLETDNDDIVEQYYNETYGGNK